MTINLEHLLKTSKCAFSPTYGLDVLVHQGIAWGPPTTVELLEAVNVFPLDPRDVLVTGYPKSGTNWMQIMLSNFWDDWGTFIATGSRRVPCMDFIGNGVDGYDISINSPPPRLMKNHLPASHMPTTWAMARAKVVYLTRDPFDVCVSFFRQLQTPGLHMDTDWDHWVERFANGHTLYGGWLEHVMKWHEKGIEDGVYHLSYEALSRDTGGEMRKAAAFLEKPLDSKRFEAVVNKARKENMDKSGFSEQITVPDLKHYRSGGTVGKGRAQFSDAQVQLFTEKLLQPLHDAGVPIDA